LTEDVGELQPDEADALIPDETGHFFVRHDSLPICVG
jgi:hypothetical protein